MDREQLEIVRLLFELRDEGMTAEAVSRLETALGDRPDLQEFYCQVVRIADLIPEEINAAVAESLTIPVATEAQPEYAPSSNGSPAQRRPAIEPLRRAATWRFPLAASIIAVLIWGALQWSGLQNDDHHPSIYQPSLVHKEYVQSTADGMEITEPRSLRLVSQAMRTAPLQRIVLPHLDRTATMGEARLSAEQNCVWLEGPEVHGRGLLVPLPAGSRMEIVARTGVRSLNTILAMLVDPDAQSPVTQVSYSASGSTGLVVHHQQAGPLGKSVIRNTSSETKHLLLVGSYAPRDTLAHGSWRTSDYRVHHASPKILVLGWEDAIYDAELTAGNSSPRTYNDMCAVVHVTRSDTLPSADETIGYDPPPTKEAEAGSADRQDRYLSVQPHECLVLLVSNSQHSPSTVDVVQRSSGQLIWQQRQTQIEPGSSLLPNVYVVTNNTSEEQQFDLFSLKAVPNSAEALEWSEAPFLSHSAALGSESFGFVNPADSSELVDWQDSWIQAFHF